MNNRDTPHEPYNSGWRRSGNSDANQMALNPPPRANKTKEFQP